MTSKSTIGLLGSILSILGDGRDLLRLPTKSSTNNDKAYPNQQSVPRGYNRYTMPGNAVNQVLPKGTRAYYFSAAGAISNGGPSSHPIRREDVVYACVAINAKSAKEKYKKHWLSKNSQQQSITQSL